MNRVLAEIPMEKKRRKISITEDDTSILLFQRYAPATILALLREVYQLANGKKIDWNLLFNKSVTGISSARECQMLWRHLAYRTPLLEKGEEGSQPLDDDSDLECELEVVPPINAEALSEAATFVQVLTNSLSHDFAGPNHSNGETLFSAVVPNGQKASLPLDEQHLARPNHGTNTMAPSAAAVKLPQPSDQTDGNARAALAKPAKKKSKKWTKQEDADLIAAVQKYGEHWNTVKGDLKHDRTTQQLAQMESNLKKGQCSSSTTVENLASCPPKNADKERINATWKAFSMAVDDHKKVLGSPQGTLSSASPPIAATSESAPASQPPKPAPEQAATQKGAPVYSSTSRITVKKLSGTTNTALTSIQKAAIAAGGRIVTPSTAASHLKAAQSKAAYHIRSGVSALPKATMPTTKLLSTTGAAGLQPLPMRPVGMSSSSTQSSASSIGADVLSQQVQDSPARSTGQIRPSTYVTSPKPSSQETIPESKALSSSCIPVHENNEKGQNTIISTNKYDLEFDEMVARDQQCIKAGECKNSGDSGKNQIVIGLGKEPANLNENWGKQTVSGATQSQVVSKTNLSQDSAKDAAS